MTVIITKGKSQTHYISNKTHRTGMTTGCPLCWQSTNEKDWIKSPHLIELIVDEPNFGGVNYDDTELYNMKVVAVSDCPKCGERSWAHWGFGSFEVRHDPLWNEPKELYPYDLDKLRTLLLDS